MCISKTELDKKVAVIREYKSIEKDAKANYKPLDDFDRLDALLSRLAASVEATREIRALFNNKNASVLIAAFKAFDESGRKAVEFEKFLEWFVNGGNETEIDGKIWDAIGVNCSTRDVNTVHKKVDYLVALMEQYFKEIRKAA